MKKRNIFATVVVLLSVLVTVSSCSKRNDANLNIDYIPFKLDKDDNWGMLKRDGTPLFKDEFEGTPSLCINNVFTVADKNGITVYTASEKPKAIKDCENLVDAGVMSEGIIPVVKKGERIKFVDVNGKVKFILQPYKNKEIEAVCSYFSDGLAWFKTSDGKYGFINTSGKVVIEPKYDGVNARFSDGLAVVYKVEKNKDDEDKVFNYIINKSGKEIKKLKEDIEILSDYEDNHFIATIGSDDNKRYVLLDKNGEITKKFPSKVKGITDMKDGKYIYRDADDKYGVNNMKDETVIRAKYESMRFLGSTGNYIAEKGSGKLVIVNDKDDKIKEFYEYEELAYFKDWDVILALNEYYDCEILNLKGETVSKEAYIINFDNPKSVKSDYFNAEALAKTIADNISDKGMGNIHLGDGIVGLLSNYSPNEYKNETMFVIYDNDKTGIKDGSKYYCGMTVVSDTVIVKEKYVNKDFYGYTYESYDGLEFNNSAKITSLYLHVILNTDDKSNRIESLAKLVKNELVKQGYKLTESRKYSFELSKGNNRVIVTPETYRLMVILTTNKYRQGLKSLKEMDNMYLDKKNNKNETENGDNNDYDYYSEPTTEPNVEEVAEDDEI